MEYALGEIVTRLNRFKIDPRASVLRVSGTKLGMEIYSYNDHRSVPFSRACWLVLAPPTYSGMGADIVMESITLFDLQVAPFDSANAIPEPRIRNKVRRGVGT